LVDHDGWRLSAGGADAGYDFQFTKAAGFNLRPVQGR
jgi:hypothetical protein